MRLVLAWLAAKVASIFTDPAYLFDEKAFIEVFGANGTQVGEVISRRGACVIIRDYESFMFTVVDIEAEGGPEIVNEYAIFRNAVIGAECWELRKQNARQVPVR